MVGDGVHRRAAAALTLTLLAALAGCSSSEPTDDPPPAAPGPPPSVPPPPSPPPSTNRAPTANAGADRVVMAGQAVSLDASASTDPDGDALTFAWNVVAGTGGALDQADQANASFQAALPGTYIIEVTVRDAGNLSGTDIVVVDVGPARSATAITLERLDAALVEGGAAVVGIYLPEPAGAGGLTVTLTSSDPAIADVPSTVDIPAGEHTAAFAIDGVAAGTVAIDASAPGVDPASLVAVVEPVAFELEASNAGVPTGQSVTVTARLRAPAPAGGTSISLSLDEGARATLGVSRIDIAAGETDGTVTLTGDEPGPVRLSATLPGGGRAMPLRLRVTPPVASADRSSAELVDEALQAGTLTEEQALVYGILADFGAAELPVQYRGNDVGRLDGQSARLAQLRLESLSQASQDAIGKYLFPPIYTGSWGAGITPMQRKAGGPPRHRAMDVSCFERLRGMPRSDTLPHWQAIRTGPFKIWYPTVLDHGVAQLQWYTAEENRAAALRVAATISRDFARLAPVLGDVLRDDGVTCNGGDDAIDVYVTRISWSGIMAQVVPYLPGECARPGWMWVAPDSIPDARSARNVVAHELVHLFQLRYTRPDCGDWTYNILDEATASWAFDFMYPRDNYEHNYLAGEWRYFDPMFGDWRAHPLEIAQGRGVRNCNGYCDYLFFEWLSRRFGPQAVRGVLDAAATTSAQQAFQVGLAGIGGGLQQLWPQYAAFLWNDYVEGVLDQLYSWEGDRLASLSRATLPPLSHAIDATLGGQPRRDLTEAFFDRHLALRGGSLPPMTTQYIHLRFTDPNVSRVRFEHRAATLRAQWPQLRVQALQKIGGTWRALEDWTGEDEKRYCRDRRAERIEELVLIYSNWLAGSELFQQRGPEVVELGPDGEEHDRLTISNAACMPWHGTTRVTLTNPLGGVIRYTANVEFRRELAPDEDPEEAEQAFLQLFMPRSGTATVEMNWPDESGCVQTVPLTSGAIGELDSRLFINFDTRQAQGVGLTTIEGVTLTLTCPQADPITVTAPMASAWLSFGTNITAPLGEDGRTLRGSVTEFNATSRVTTTYEWNLIAQPEE